ARRRCRRLRARSRRTRAARTARRRRRRLRARRRRTRAARTARRRRRRLRARRRRTRAARTARRRRRRLRARRRRTRAARTARGRARRLRARSRRARAARTARGRGRRLRARSRRARAARTARRRRRRLRARSRRARAARTARGRARRRRGTGGARCRRRGQGRHAEQRYLAALPPTRSRRGADELIVDRDRTRLKGGLPFRIDDAVAGQLGRRVEDSLSVLVDGIAEEKGPPDQGGLALELILEDDGPLLEGSRPQLPLHLVTFEVIEVQGGRHAVLLGRHTETVRSDEPQHLVAELIA